MGSQVLRLALLVSALLVGFISGQESSPLKSIAALAGKVFNPDGHPAAGVRIELQNPGTGIPVTSTYTRRDGTFALKDVPNGDYEVVAESSDSLVSDNVSLQPGERQLQLRFTRENASEYSSPTVSVAQMLVPLSAQRSYERARHELFDRNDYAKAQRLVDAALELDSEFPDALALRGVIQIRNNQFEPAKESLQRALEIDPNQSTALVLLAALFNHLGRFDDAMNLSARAIALAPNAWQGYLEMAKASVAKNLYENALRLIRHAEKSGGMRYAEVHLVRAFALLPLKHDSDARHELEVALSREPTGTVADLAKRLIAQMASQQSVALAAAN